MPWAPTTDFENEVVSFQPDHDFIFGSLSAPQEDEDHYPRPESHLRYILEKKKKNNEQNEIVSSSKSKKLSIISKVQRIAGTKPLGEQPTLEDWDDDTNVERETIAMMRHLGLQPSMDEALDEQRTIATLPLSNEVLVMHNGRRRMPILYNEKFFKLKPRVPLPFDDNEATTEQDKRMSSNSTPSRVQREKLNHAENSAKDEDVPDTADSNSATDNSFYYSATEESFKTAYNKSYTPSRNRSVNLAFRFRNNSIAVNSYSEDSKNRSERANDENNAKTEDSKCYFTAKELYLKHRKN